MAVCAVHESPTLRDASVAHLRAIPGSVDLWSARLDDPSQDIHALWRLLSVDEQSQADRYRLQVARDRFIVRRGVLRSILASYLGARPEHLRFTYGVHGKPALDPGSNDKSLQFNLSHSHGLALYAVTVDRCVGVDVERFRVDLRHGALVRRYFSPHETAEYQDLPARLRARAFFHGWTLKESYVKALGTGLATPFHTFTVPMRPPTRYPAASTPSLTTQIPPGWTLSSVALAPHYATAITTAGRLDSIRHRGAWPVGGRES